MIGEDELDATIDEQPQPSSSESAEDPGRVDEQPVGTSTHSPPADEDLGEAEPSVTAESVYSVESTESAMTDDVLIHTAHEVCPPPFLTDGRGRVVWSNTSASK